VLLLFEEISGLKINFHKSTMFGVNVVDRVHEVTSVMNCKHDHIFVMYLGLPIGGHPRKLHFWYPLIDHMIVWLEK